MTFLAPNKHAPGMLNTVPPKDGSGCLHAFSWFAPLDPPRLEKTDSLRESFGTVVLPNATLDGETSWQREGFNLLIIY